MIFFDTETCGYHGPMVLTQYAIDDGPIVLHETFCNPVGETLALFEELTTHDSGICGFNLTYDWFHVVKLYTMFVELAKQVGDDAEPRDHIELLADLEPSARDGRCLKPVTAIDLMLHARKGPYQSTMDRKMIRIKRVPRTLAHLLAQELEARVPISDIHFSKSKDKGGKWKIFDIMDIKTRQPDPDFVDIRLKFSPSSALKAICFDAGLRNKDSRLLFHDVAAEPRPIEVGWAPFAKAISNRESDWYAVIGKKKGYTWPKVIDNHIYHWRFDPLAREYATDDVIDTRALYHHFGDPPSGDDDSILACMVGAVRWRGFAINEKRIRELQAIELAKIKDIPKAPHHVYHYLTQVMSDTETKALADKDGKRSTKRIVLERIEKLTRDCTCVKETKIKESTGDKYAGFGVTTVRYAIRKIADERCPKCKGTGTVKHPVAERATQVLDARKGYTKNVLYKKLIDAGRLHPSASVTGSLSGRMSGRTEVGDGKRAANINALGIQHDKVIRSAFPLAIGDHQLNGGDFEAYEVGIADAAYNDPDLRMQLLTCHVCGVARPLSKYDETPCPNCDAREGWCDTCKCSTVTYDGNCPICQSPLKSIEPTLRKIHGLFAMELYPPNSYADILKTKGTANDLYDKGKRSIFSQFYGGNEITIVERVGADLEQAKQAAANFKKRYKGVGRAYERCYDDFCSMRQPEGIGKTVYWHEPKEYVESLNGFRRSFLLENKITKSLFHLAEKPPDAWLRLKIKVRRRDRDQLIGNAVRSALFAAAFQIQAQCMRAALNHLIQSTGAIETKRLQRRIWDLQPSGVHKWLVQPLNVHDEIMAPSVKEIAPQIESIVRDFIIERRSLIPLLKMEWKSNMKNWAAK